MNKNLFNLELFKHFFPQKQFLLLILHDVKKNMYIAGMCLEQNLTLVM